VPEIDCGFKDLPTGVSGSQLLINLGPTVKVDIGFDPNWKLHGGSVPIPAIKDIDALVDTGATVSCIDDSLAVQLKLPFHDEQPMAGVGGQHMAKMYIAQIHVPLLKFTIYGTFAGVHLAAGGQIHRALIGRTFLTRFKMVYEGATGIVKLSSVV